jgi:hypothetical protein
MFYTYKFSSYTQRPQSASNRKKKSCNVIQSKHGCLLQEPNGTVCTKCRHFSVTLALHKVMCTLRRPAVKHMRLCCIHTHCVNRSHEGLPLLYASYYSVSFYGTSKERAELQLQGNWIFWRKINSFETSEYYNIPSATPVMETETYIRNSTMQCRPKHRQPFILWLLQNDDCNMA